MVRAIVLLQIIMSPDELMYVSHIVPYSEHQLVAWHPKCDKSKGTHQFLRKIQLRFFKISQQVLGSFVHPRLFRSSLMKRLLSQIFAEAMLPFAGYAPWSRFNLNVKNTWHCRRCAMRCL